jgi:hypothetical protein
MNEYLYDLVEEYCDRAGVFCNELTSLETVSALPLVREHPSHGPEQGIRDISRVQCQK